MTKNRNVGDILDQQTTFNVGLQVGANVLLSNTAVKVGNSTVNATVNSTMMSLNGILYTNQPQLRQNIGLYGSNSVTANTAVDLTNEFFPNTAFTFVNGDLVRIVSTGTVPTGLAIDTNYYVVSTNSTGFKLSATDGGSAINLTGEGTGTHTIYRTLNSMMAGPYIIATGITLTIPSGSRMVIV